MRRILLCAITLLSLTVAAQAQMPLPAPANTPAAAPAADLPHSEMPAAAGVPGELAPETQDKPGDDVLNKYYDRCMANIYTDLSTDAREEFCACSAAQMKDTMSAGEMITLTDQKGGQKVDMVKLAVNVVAPCFAPVAQEIEYNKCEDNTMYVHMYRTRDAFDATCRCIGGRAGDYVQTYGRDLMAYTLALNPRRANNPDVALQDAPEYRNEVAKALNPCMNKYVGK